MSTRLKVLLAAVAAVVVLAGVGLWWFFRDDAPDEVSLDAAIESVDDTESTGSTATPDTPAGVEGTWTVDTETGEFDYETATGTFAGFRVDEELSGIGSATAVGRTGDVSGSVTIDGTTLTDATFEVDLTTITTNATPRDEQVQAALETSTYPTATFALTEPVELGDTAAAGGAVSVVAAGDLTVHGTTLPVEVAIDAQLVGETIVLVGTTDVLLSEFGIEVPSAPLVLSVDDDTVVEMQLLLVRS